MLLTVEQISDVELRELVREFLDLHFWLESPEAADGECGNITEDFYAYLESRKFDDSRFERGNQYPLWWWNSEGELDLDRSGCVPAHSYFYHNGWPGHTCAWIADVSKSERPKKSGIFIDFTARQFGENVPFPLIWR